MSEKNIMELFSMKERTVVLTGGAGGLGLSLAQGLAQAGANIAILDVRESFNLDFLDSSYGGQYRYYRADVTNHHSLGKVFDTISDDFGGIHGWYVKSKHLVRPRGARTPTDILLQRGGSRYRPRQGFSRAYSRRDSANHPGQCMNTRQR